MEVGERKGKGREGSDEATDACLTDVVVQLAHYKTGGSSSCRNSVENNIINRGHYTKSSSSAALRKWVAQRMKLVQERAAVEDHYYKLRRRTLLPQSLRTDPLTTLRTVMESFHYLITFYWGAFSLLHISL